MARLESLSPRYSSSPNLSSFGYWMSYATFYVCGASNVVSWLSFVLCINYYSVRYPDGLVEFVFPIINMSIVFLVTLLILMAGRVLPVNGRIHFGLSFQAIFLIVTPFIQFIKVSNDQGYTLVLLSLIGCTLSCSTVQASLYGIGGIFGSDFLQALEAGKGASGVVLVIIRCLTKWYFGESLNPEEYSPSLFFFFGISSFITLVGLFLFFLLHYLDYAKPKLQEYYAVQQATPITPSRNLRPSTPPLASPKNITESTCLLEVLEDFDESPTVGSVFPKLWKTSIILFGSYFVCLSCFPGLTESIPAISIPRDWFSIILVASYNLGDFIGKSFPPICMLFQYQNIHRPMLIHLCFIPLFILDFLFPLGDVYTIVLVFLLGGSTGYTGTSCMMIVPTICNELEKEIASIISSMCLILGLFVGSYVGLAIDYLIST